MYFYPGVSRHETSFRAPSGLDLVGCAASQQTRSHHHRRAITNTITLNPLVVFGLCPGTHIHTHITQQLPMWSAEEIQKFLRKQIPRCTRSQLIVRKGQVIFWNFSELLST